MAAPPTRLAWAGTPPGTPPNAKRPPKNGDGGALQRSQSEGGTLARPGASHTALGATLSTSFSQTLLPDKPSTRQTRAQVQEIPVIDPELELRTTEPEFEEDHKLIQELKAIFDWMAQEKNATKISRRAFTHRLPELQRRMPQIARSFRFMDKNGDSWLEWWEFKVYCLSEPSLVHQMKKASTVTVYAKERDGQISYKELLDPIRMCDVGTCPSLLPWEMSHVIEWRIDNLICSKQGGAPVRHGPTVVRPGTSFASPPFRGAGVCGFLRFWPAGYWTEAQRRLKVQAATPHCISDAKANGPHPSPPPDAWCCVGCSVPAGTHLVIRFFVGDRKSEKREVFWHEGNFPGMLWAPEGMERPVLKEGDSYRVGVEIFRNLGACNGHPPKQHKQQGVKERTPVVRDLAEGVEAFKAGHVEKLANKTMSLPALPDSATWRNLDKLLRAYRREVDAKAVVKDKSVSFKTASASTL